MGFAMPEAIGVTVWVQSTMKVHAHAELRSGEVHFATTAGLHEASGRLTRAVNSPALQSIPSEKKRQTWKVVLREFRQQRSDNGIALPAGDAWSKDGNLNIREGQRTIATGERRRNTEHLTVRD